jgi:hypothetical protein
MPEARNPEPLKSPEALNHALRWSLKAALLAAAAFTMSACSVLDRTTHAEALAQPAGLAREQIDTGTFVLTAWSRVARRDQDVTIYLEGDGLASLSSSQPSLDPTPAKATGLTLAAADPASNVAYLARPCQFTPMEVNPRCGVPYWTSRRFSPEVIDAMNVAIDRLAARVPGRRINLVGYSGGAAIAVLVAARRHDVASIRTVAGNLDDEYINQLHGVSAMPESENPIDHARQVANVPQLHFSGADDEVVPPSVAARFIAATGARCAHHRIVPGVAHEGEWAKRWPALLAEQPLCTDR